MMALAAGNPLAHLPLYLGGGSTAGACGSIGPATAVFGRIAPQKPLPSQKLPVELERFDKCLRHCHDPDFDLHLVARLVELLGVRARFSLTFALSQRFNATPQEVEAAVQLILRCFRLLHLCGYSRDDLQIIVAHASSYLQDVIAAMARAGQPEMSISELAHVFCVLMFIAHSHCEDNNCPLKVWHRHLFNKYCSLPTLNVAVVRLLESLAYVLRVGPPELRQRLEFLQAGFESVLADKDGTAVTIQK